LTLHAHRLRAVLSDGWQGILYPLGWLEPLADRGDEAKIHWELSLDSHSDLSEQLATVFAPPWVCSAKNLSPEEIDQAIGDLAGVILSCPWSASEADRLALREAVLQTSWGAKSAQVYFLPESIASLLSAFPPSDQWSHWSQDDPIEGATLVIQGSDRDTELALTEIPAYPSQTVTFEQFWLTGLNYGQNDLTQDVIRHLLYPLLPSNMTDRFSLETFEESSLGENRDGRQRYQTQLSRSPLGSVLLEAAERLLIALETQPQFTLRISQETHILYKQELQSQVLHPYQHQLVRAIEELLHHSEISATAIKQVLWTGRFGCRDFYLPWLQQQFPQATIWEDQTDPTDQTETAPDSLVHHSIALGLATLPFYPSALALSDLQSGR